MITACILFNVTQNIWNNSLIKLGQESKEAKARIALKSNNQSIWRDDLFPLRSFLEYHAIAHNNLYVSRHHGNDSYNCGSKEEPCRTLARGIRIADRNDRILLDGSFTKSDPYNCEIMNLEKKGKTEFLKDENHTVNVKVSLQIIGFPSPAFISCDDLLRFTGSSTKKEEMDVNFTSIVFTNTSMVFIDSSVSFVHCSFLQSYSPIQIKLVFQQSATVAVKGSLFYNNTGCIRLALFKNDTQAAIHLDNVNFTQNRLLSENEGSGISIYGHGSLQMWLQSLSSHAC